VAAEEEDSESPTPPEGVASPTERTAVEKRGEGSSKPKRKGVVVSSLNKPLFHVDLTGAVQGAIANAEARQELRASMQARES
jgi:sodium-independent sulfate anion transporter 11